MLGRGDGLAARRVEPGLSDALGGGGVERLERRPRHLEGFDFNEHAGDQAVAFVAVGGVAGDVITAGEATHGLRVRHLLVAGRAGTRHDKSEDHNS